MATLASLFTQLPIDLIHLILGYDGRIRYHHGKYLTRLPATDPRYTVLATLPRTDGWVSGANPHKYYGIEVEFGDLSEPWYLEPRMMTMDVDRVRGFVFYCYRGLLNDPTRRYVRFAETFY